MVSYRRAADCCSDLSAYMQESKAASKVTDRSSHDPFRTDTYDVSGFSLENYIVLVYIWKHCGNAKANRAL